MKILYIAIMHISVLFLFSTAGSAQAQQAQQETRIAATPAIIDIAATPGESVDRVIRISNNSDFPLPIRVEVERAVFEGEPIDSRFSERRYDVSSWVSLDEDTYIFEAGQTREISFKVTVPLNVNPGGHYGQIRLQGLALERQDIDAGRVFPELGVPLLVTVPGEVIETAQVTGNIFSGLYQGSADKEVSFYVENTGNIHNLVHPTLTVYKGDTAVLEQELQPVIVLPGTRRLFTTAVGGLGYGRYTGAISFDYGSTQRVIASNTETFVVSPSLFRVFLFIGAAFVAVFFIRSRQRLVPAFKTLMQRG